MEQLESPSRDPEAHASNGELSSLLGSALEALAEGYRAVFVLREVEGLSTAETSEALGLSEESVKVRLHRARRTLRRHIDQRMDAETRQLYAFHLSRCDRIVAGVLSRINPSPDPG